MHSTTNPPVTVIESEETLGVVREVFEAFDHHDLDHFRKLLADDAILNVGGGPETFEGAESIVAAVSQTFKLIPDLSVTVLNAFASGPNGLAEVVREGTHQGPVPLPDGTGAPATGRTVRLPECVVFKVREEKIVRMVVYADHLDTSRQFGLLSDEGLA